MWILKELTLTLKRLNFLVLLIIPLKDFLFMDPQIHFLGIAAKKFGVLKEFLIKKLSSYTHTLQGRLSLELITYF